MHHMYLFYSKLLGGGIESMAITEAFGGKITFIVKKYSCHYTRGLSQKCQHYFILQSSGQGRPSCLTPSVVRMELCKCGCYMTICEATCENLCFSAVYVQSLLSCQVMMATQVGKSSSLTQRTPCILRIMLKGTQSSWNNTFGYFTQLFFSRNLEKKKMQLWL